MKEKHLLKELVTLLLILTVFLIVPKAFSQKTSLVSRCQTIEIKMPSAELSKDTAAFSGRWVGSWDNMMDFFIVVTEIDREKAEVVYGVGENPAFHPSFRGTQTNFDAKVIPGKGAKIEFRVTLGGFVSWVTCEMQEDLKTLKAISAPQGAQGGPGRKATLQKIE